MVRRRTVWFQACIVPGNCEPGSGVKTRDEPVETGVDRRLSLKNCDTPRGVGWVG